MPRPQVVWNRFQILFLVLVFFFLIILGRLFWLQIMHGEDYQQLAEVQNSRGVTLPARRGNIYTRDPNTKELFPLAQNSTSYTIFADPFEIPAEQEDQIVAKITPLLFPLFDFTAYLGGETEELNFENLTVEEQKDLAAQNFKKELKNKLTTKKVVRREIHDVTLEELQIVEEAMLSGVSREADILVLNPTLIHDPEAVSLQLATILETDYDQINALTLPKEVRYVKLASRVTPELKTKILALEIRGIGAIPEYRRVYPEANLAAQVIGFLNHDEEGVYGIEGAFDRLLSGSDGLRQTQVDPSFRHITTGDFLLKEAVDGASLVLTLDRSIQNLLEKHLTEMVEQEQADSGQAIVLDPKTGAILALAHVPNFDPNNFGEVYEREKLILTTKENEYLDAAGNVVTEVLEFWRTEKGEELVVEYEREYIIREGFRYPVFREINARGEIERAIYANRLGAGALALKAATEPYEPGSVFKPIVMAAALDAGEVTPTTLSEYNGPIELEEMIRGRPIMIRNAQGKYYDYETMTEVLENSSNIGMAFVAQKLGRMQFYDYLTKFGFGERTDIEFEGENLGSIENYTKWSESELITKAFGQGLTVNLFQLASAYGALANQGLLMQPYIVDAEIWPDGRIVKHEPKTIRRVIDAEVATTITQMLISSVRKGVAKVAGVEGYFVAGKTGTSQTYSNSGRALSDLGTTVAAFAGYAPATNPQFVLIVKVDRPRKHEWGAAVAAPVFQKVAQELLRNYFAVVPN